MTLSGGNRYDKSAAASSLSSIKRAVMTELHSTRPVPTIALSTRPFAEYIVFSTLATERAIVSNKNSSSVKLSGSMLWTHFAYPTDGSKSSTNLMCKLHRNSRPSAREMSERPPRDSNNNITTLERNGTEIITLPQLNLAVS